MVGIRGAITVESNEKDAIIAATRELLSEIIKENELSEGEIVAIIFSSTKDLTKAFPAEAARKMGYNETALFCCQELCIEESIERCVRVLIFADGDRLNKKTVKFVYLKGAKALRS
ncbi:MAG: chorismate mutase [Clostridia bacterium]